MATLAKVTVCQECGYYHHLQLQPLLKCPMCGCEHLEVLSQFDVDRLLASLPDPPDIRQELIN